MYYKQDNATKSRTSPIGGKRGCLCPDRVTYHNDCCNGNLINQGVGNLTGQNG
tara:strand:+ start:14260 stop:14418 length:159 start_codon:yes stop_codon:yes gene_type:complete